MYRYQNLRGLREKINELNNNFIIMYGALDNTVERIKLDNLEMFAKQLLKQTEECSNFLDENVIEMIEDNAYSLFILRLSEIKSILKMLKEVFENSPKVIDNDLLEDICNVLIRLSDECVSAIQNSRCKIYPNENI